MASLFFKLSVCYNNDNISSLMMRISYRWPPPHQYQYY